MYIGQLSAEVETLKQFLPTEILIIIDQYRRSAIFNEACGIQILDILRKKLT